MELTQARLRELVQYDPNNGIFIWIVNRRGRGAPHKGKIAGWIQPAGKRRKPAGVLSIDGKVYLRCRLAWLYMTGSWPQHEIDHRDLDRLNDRWENLRDATRSQNEANRPMRRTNTTGFKCVIDDRCGGYAVQVRRGYKRGTVPKLRIYKGGFENASDAYEFYLSVSKRLDLDFVPAMSAKVPGALSQFPI